MARVKVRNRETYYECEECGYLYKEEAWAKKCEAWCREHQSCNLKILKHGTSSENVGR